MNYVTYYLPVSLTKLRQPFCKRIRMMKRLCFEAAAFVTSKLQVFKIKFSGTFWLLTATETVNINL